MSAHFRSAHHGVGDGLLKSFDELTGDVKQLSPAGKRIIGLTLVAAIKEELSTPGRGKLRRGETVRKGKGSRRKDKTVRTRGVPMTKLGTRASAPGDPPAPDSGALRNSVLYHEQNGKDVVGVDQPQAPALEYGTKSAGKNHNVTILPRPFMRPAFQKVRDHLGPDVAVALKTKPRE
jgi:phage gpG-like protein